MYPASPFPESFQARKLVVLTLFRTTQEELWRGYKCLPCLKELHLSYAYNLVMTPDIGGFPGLQKLTLDNCEKLEEIHPSLGNHSSLVSVHVKMCEKLEEFPTIVQMRKLEVLDISYCYALSKFPKMEANMDSLVNLSLTMVGIDVLPLTVGKYCTKLQLLKLEDCFNLKSIEGNFHALKHLQKCNITCYPEPIKLPKDLFLEHVHLEELCLLSTRQPCIPHLPRLLRILTLHNCGLKDGEIPCDIGELSNLQELDLSMNQFSRLNFSLSLLTPLKLLNLQWCRKLVELPELPTSIAILCADFCESLEVVGDTINRNCKWLCEVSFRQVKSIIRAVYLLQTMLQGHAIEYGCMRLSLKGLEIPKAFTPPLLLSGNRYRLQLSENWYNHFSGFLLCATLRDYTNSQYITMKHDEDGLTSRDVFWEESVEDVQTWVGYVSFASLKHTRWFDPTSVHVDFFFDIMINGKPEACSSGFGVRLVSKKGQSDRIETDFSQLCDYYTSEFSIQADSESHLACGFGINVVVIRERD